MRTLFCIFTTLSSLCSCSALAEMMPEIRYSPPPPLIQQHRVASQLQELHYPLLAIKSGFGCIMDTFKPNHTRVMVRCQRHNQLINVTHFKDEDINDICHQIHAYLPHIYRPTMTATRPRGLAGRRPIAELAEAPPAQPTFASQGGGCLSQQEHRWIDAVSKARFSNPAHAAQRIDSQEQDRQYTDIDTKFAAVIQAAHNDIETGIPLTLPEAVSDTLSPALTRIRYAHPTTSEDNRSHCETIQENLIYSACEKALSLDALAAINTTKACLVIDDAVQEADSVMYTRQADSLRLQVAELHTIAGAIRTTELDRTHPEIAARLIVGNNNCNLHVIHYLDDTFSNLDPRCHAALRNICASVDTVNEEATLSTETREKIIRAADKIIWAINHFVCNDISLNAQQNASSFFDAHDTSAEAIKDYLCGLITHMDNYNSMPRAANAYHAMRDLGLGRLKTVFSEAKQCINAEKDVEHYFTIGNELGLGILTMQAIEGMLKSAGDIPEAAEPLHQSESVEHIPEERDEAANAALADDDAIATEEMQPIREQLHPSLVRATGISRKTKLQMAGLAFVSVASLKYLLSRKKNEEKRSHETMHTQESSALSP